MNEQRVDAPAPGVIPPGAGRDDMRRGPEPPPTAAELEAMERRERAMDAPITDGETLMTQQREDTNLSTADVASAMDQRGAEAGTGPKYVEGEETRADAMTNTTARSTPLFPENEVQGLRSQWQEVQTGFVDEPRQSVEKADHLVAEVMKRLAEGFARERGNLEQQWDRGDNINTEDLRLALQRYRSFFERLLSA